MVEPVKEVDCDDINFEGHIDFTNYLLVHCLPV